jgi:hypothetical protein
MTDWYRIDMHTFIDNGYTIWNIADRFLVRCPGCTSMAVVQPEGGGRARFSCTRCGKSGGWQDRHEGSVLYATSLDHFESGRVCIGAPVDWYFHLPLWLQTECCGEVLWAYNKDHLDWLRNFVNAKLRKRSYDPTHGWSNQSLASRLPKWMKSARNKSAVQKALDKLYATIA